MSDPIPAPASPAHPRAPIDEATMARLVTGLMAARDELERLRILSASAITEMKRLLDEAQAESAALRARLDAAERDFELMRVFAYGFARHIRNVKDLPATRWGLLGLDLLADLHAINPERYDREVTALAARGREAGEP